MAAAGIGPSHRRPRRGGDRARRIGRADGDPQGVGGDPRRDAWSPSPGRGASRPPSRRSGRAAAAAGSRPCRTSRRRRPFASTRQLRQEGRLTVRINEWAPLAEGHRSGRSAARTAGPRRSRICAARPSRRYLDGTLGSRTAAMIEPYADAPAQKRAGADRRGAPAPARHSGPRAGFQVALHAIGDKAARMALDAIASISARRDSAAGTGSSTARSSSPADIPRFARRERWPPCSPHSFSPICPGCRAARRSRAPRAPSRGAGSATGVRA